MENEEEEEEKDWQKEHQMEMQGLLGIEGDAMILDMAQLPFQLGGLALGSAVRSSCAAHWASWADSLPTTQKRHPAVARLIV